VGPATSAERLLAGGGGGPIRRGGAGQVPAQTTYGVTVALSSGTLSFSTERQAVPDGKVRLSVMPVSCVACTPPLSGTFGLGQVGWTVVWAPRPATFTAARCTSRYPAGEPQMAQVVPKASVADVLSNTTFHEYWVCVPISFLLGYVLATTAVQGLLKTAATVALFFPLLVLAVPIVDTTFVVVRRLKHGERVFEADQAHLHHRFLRRGFSQRRAAVTIWGWCASLAAAAFATRFVPFRAHGVWHPWWTLLAVAIGLVAVLFSVYVVYVLEIVKLGNRIQRRRKPGDPLRKTA